MSGWARYSVWVEIPDEIDYEEDDGRELDEYLTVVSKKLNEIPEVYETELVDME